ncbi:MAG TPA: hypothetical protein VJ692_16095 [Nitrospiraceae bacterium]|nr:hypothetical protein [Nitrospiraceae bacterium]
MAGVSFSEAAEYYSWIDPSGTAILTDNPSQIPPASERSAVSVYRYPDLPSGSLSRRTTETVSDGLPRQNVAPSTADAAEYRSSSA